MKIQIGENIYLKECDCAKEHIVINHEEKTGYCSLCDSQDFKEVEE